MTRSFGIVAMEVFQNILRVIESILACPAGLVGISNSTSAKHSLSTSSSRSIRDFEQEIRSQFTGHLTDATLLHLSNQLQQSYREKLQSSPQCMLPSFNHTLPSGKETGTFLVLDVGGSTFRTALVSLSGRGNGLDGMRIVRMTSTIIDEKVRALNGTDFFNWMASRIKETLKDGPEVSVVDGQLPIGLSWSFPIEQTSIRGGRIQNMGKGFNCSQDTIGQDLGVLIETACSKQGLDVRIDAINNDSSSTLLSRAYIDPATSMSLILGTGTNAAVYLPVSDIGLQKYGDRDASWHAEAKSVIVNTELSMFGGNILPTTRWDDQLNQSHVLPDFQPLEYMCTGRYLGEIVRLIILEATEHVDLFGGRIPQSMTTPYSLDTTFLAILESDTTPTLSRALSYLEKMHTFTDLPSLEDLLLLRTVAECVSTRSAAYLATSIHALWALNRNPTSSTNKKPSSSNNELDKTTIACEGSVINKYPGFREMCQSYIARMIAADTTITTHDSTTFADNLPEIHLEPAHEATILGAAVAVAICATHDTISSSSSSSSSSSQSSLSP